MNWRSPGEAEQVGGIADEGCIADSRTMIDFIGLSVEAGHQKVPEARQSAVALRCTQST